MHSPTTGLADTTSALPGWARTHAAKASALLHVLKVPVSSTGVSRVPNSATWVVPVSLPKPLPTNTAAGAFSRNTLPGWRMVTVTPARRPSPATTVTWPTRTQATSVIASNGPGGRTPVRTPACRARGWGCGEGGTVAVAARSELMGPPVRCSAAIVRRPAATETTPPAARPAAGRYTDRRPTAISSSTTPGPRPRCRTPWCASRPTRRGTPAGACSSGP